MFDFDGAAPPLACLRVRIVARVHHIPSLCYRLGRNGRKAYAAGEYEPRAHVLELLASCREQFDAVRRQMLTRPLPEDRPPWDLWLIRCAEESFTVCFRSDHALRDGIAAASILRLLIDDEPEEWSPRFPPSARVRLRGVAAALGQSARAMRPLTPAPAFAGAEAGTPQMFHRDLPLALLRGAARAHGATVNDVYLAALSEAVHRRHQEGTPQGHPPMPVTVPLSVRGRDQATRVGNALVGVRLTLPCKDSGGVEGALHAVTAQTRRLRAIDYRGSARLVLEVLPRRAGARLALRVAGAGPVGLLASNVDCGPTLTLFGLPAAQAQLFSAPADGLRCYTALTGYDSQARLTVVHDGSLTGMPHLGEHWVAAVRELAQAPHAAEPDAEVVRSAPSRMTDRPR
ncbi:wax ester/triacylglycerol synthase domain-containing protein [Streptomyces sp. NPDC006261]|uniref:wax ester/triacylglycerol synthase domain-containing protein n=1 Tax=Streptomyces sp. NPDC006261 TaxID=3156739 RepID=UPI0033AA0DCD